MLAFANFGTALRSSADPAKSNSSAVLDYSKQDLSISSEAREKVSAFCWVRLYAYRHADSKLHTQAHVLQTG